MKTEKHWCICNDNGEIALAFISERQAIRNIPSITKGFRVRYSDNAIPQDYAQAWADLKPYKVDPLHIPNRCPSWRLFNNYAS